MLQISYDCAGKQKLWTTTMGRMVQRLYGTPLFYSIRIVITWFFLSWPGEKLHITNNETVIVWNSYYDGPQILQLQSANITNSEVVQLKPPQLTGLTQLQIYCLIVTSKGWIACLIFSKMRRYSRYVNLPRVLPLPAFVGLGPCSSAPNGMLLFNAFQHCQSASHTSKDLGWFIAPAARSF